LATEGLRKEVAVKILNALAYSRCNMLQQQENFAHFMRVYNYERPHEGIEMKITGDLYRPSSRQHTGLPELAYPFHDRTIVITECGRICMDRKKIMLSSVLAGQKVGVMQVEEQI